MVLLKPSLWIRNCFVVLLSDIRWNLVIIIVLVMRLGVVMRVVMPSLRMEIGNSVWRVLINRIRAFNFGRRRMTHMVIIGLFWRRLLIIDSIWRISKFISICFSVEDVFLIWNWSYLLMTSLSSVGTIRVRRSCELRSVILVWISLVNSVKVTAMLVCHFLKILRFKIK